MWHPKWLLSKHVVPSCISNLSHIPEPNVVLISQDKPDHCHEPTLKQLDPTSRITTILAEPAAAKRIRGIKHFDPSRVYALPAFSDRKPNTVIRFRIPGPIPGSIPGEATIAFIPAKLDVPGLHNAIGITYRPPSSACPVPISMISGVRCSQSAANLRGYDNWQDLPITTPDSPPLLQTRTHSTNNTASVASTPQSISAFSHTSSNFSVSSKSSVNSFARPTQEKTLSIIYSPHGVSYSLIRAYASSHLVSQAALPLTALIHSFDRVQNPWWMGGNVSAGLPGGVEMAQNLMARYWIKAHDEDKENSGLAVKKVMTRKYRIGEVKDLLQVKGKGGRCGTTVVALDVGQEMVIKA